MAYRTLRRGGVGYDNTRIDQHYECDCLSFDLHFVASRH
jgi:hypothetical protein